MIKLLLVLILALGFYAGVVLFVPVLLSRRRARQHLEGKRHDRAP